MAVTAVQQDPENLTMTLTAAFGAPRERVWQLWRDPRKLERWWGPPTYPATFVSHDLRPGGSSSYVMTGPQGDKSHGWWRVREVEEPQRIVIEDGFADDSGRPDLAMPVMVMEVHLADTGAGTSMTVVGTFPSAEAMEQILAMGAEEGMRQAMGQMDALLEE